MTRRSAGILLYKGEGDDLRVLLVHPGGPFWRRRDDGAWTIPKGEYEPDEDAEQAARREFAEEVGSVPDGPLQSLGEVRQRGGKIVTAFALRGEFDVATLRSNTFALEWPPRSGRTATFPEVDRAAWFTLAEARTKILPSQQPLLDELARLCGGEPPDA